MCMYVYTYSDVYFSFQYGNRPSAPPSVISSKPGYRSTNPGYGNSMTDIESMHLSMFLWKHYQNHTRVEERTALRLEATVKFLEKNTKY